MDKPVDEGSGDHYRFEVISRASPYFGRVDFIYSDADLYLSAGHTYHVRVSTDTQAPRVVKVFREVPR